MIFENRKMSFGPLSTAAGLHTISNTELTPPLQIQPSQLKIDISLHTEHIVELSLINPTPSTIAFKIKTTNREHYSLRPTQDIVGPNSTKICKIVCNKFHTVPELPQGQNYLKDKFLIQSVIVPNPATIADLTKFWRELEAV